MSPAQRRNVAILVREQARVAALVEELGRELTPDETQDQINRINRKLDLSAGIVAGDGNYYPREGYP